MEQQEDFAQQVAAQLEQLYGVEWLAAATPAIPNMYNGSSWGIIDKSTKDRLESLGVASSEKDGYRLYPVSRNMTLVYHDWATLADRIQSVSGLFSEKDYELAAKHRQKAVEGLEKLLAKRAPEVTLGFFSVNDSPTITVNGKVNPAFSVDLDTLLHYAALYKYNLRTLDKVRTGNPVMWTPVQAVSYTDDFLRTCFVPSSKNAVLVTLVAA